MESRTNAAVAAMDEYTPIKARKALTEALLPFGGLDWVIPGMKIAIKVNLVSAKKPESAATTHPLPVRVLCEMLREKGAQVVVGDSPGGLFTATYLAPIYKICGMREVINGGARLNDDFEEAHCDFPQGVKLKSFPITKYLLDADCVINFCKLKTHGLTAYTGACKNLFGAIPGLKKSQYHYLFPKTMDFADMLVDICEAVAPKICIADGVIAMEGNGPTAGTPRKIGVIIASASAHALDMVGSALMGLSPKQVPTLNAAIQRKLIPDRIEKLVIAGDWRKFKVADFKVPALRPIKSWGEGNAFLDNLLESLLANKPHLVENRCTGCGICRQRCPAEAITLKNKKPVIDRKKCIRCFCCQEFCDRAAMQIKRTPLAKLIYK